MTPPARNTLPDPNEAARAHGTARWLNMVTTTVLGATVLIVAIAALPSVLRAGLGASADEQAFPPPVRAQQPTFSLRPHPGAHSLGRVPDDDALQDDEDTDGPARGPGARGGVTGPNDPRVLRPPSSEDDDELGLKGGVTVRPLPLRDRRTNAVVHEVRAGEKIRVLHEDGEWVLVVRGGSTESTTGWARRSELLLR